MYLKKSLDGVRDAGAELDGHNGSAAGARHRRRHQLRQQPRPCLHYCGSTRAEGRQNGLRQAVSQSGLSLPFGQADGVYRICPASTARGQYAMESAVVFLATHRNSGAATLCCDLANWTSKIQINVLRARPLRQPCRRLPHLRRGWRRS